MDKVKYRCKGCGWSKELPNTWGDIKPRFCPTPTCEMSVKKSKGRKSFKNNPEMLEMTFSTTKNLEQKPEETSHVRERKERRPSKPTESVPNDGSEET
jgi:hypothetical protein